VSFIDELLKMTSSQYEPKQKLQRKKRPDRGVTGLLHLLSKKIAVLVRLATLFSKAKQLSKSAELVRQIDFLVSVLRGITTFSQQHVVDLEHLLVSISDHIDANSSASANGKQTMAFHLRSFMNKDRVDMSLPLQQLKTHWQMCMSCGKLMFGLKAEHTKCIQETCDDLLERPLFAVK
jgi:hypothetical protein